jgi:hypothetical protein
MFKHVCRGRRAPSRVPLTVLVQHPPLNSTTQEDYPFFLSCPVISFLGTTIILSKLSSSPHIWGVIGLPALVSVLPIPTMHCCCPCQSSWLPQCHFVSVVPVFLSSSMSWFPAIIPHHLAAPLRCLVTELPIISLLCPIVAMSCFLFKRHLPILLSLVVLPAFVISVWWCCWI